MSGACPLANPCVDVHMLLCLKVHLRVGDVADMSTSCPFSKLLSSQGPIPGSPWGGAGASSSQETGSLDVQSSREQGSPFVPPIIPSPPGPLSPSNQGLRSSLGAVGDEGVTSVSPSLHIPCARGF